jgi:hypothetical protein
LENFENGQNTIRIKFPDTFTIGLDSYPALLEAGTWLDVDSYSYEWFANGKEIQFSFTISEWKDSTKITETVDAANIMVNQTIRPYMNNREKYLALHNALIASVDYVTDSVDKGQTAYSALVAHEAVCGGYSKSYKLLCDLAGLPCIYVSGMAGTTENNGRHAWNMVPVDGQWLYIDSTWDDSYTDNRYFLRDETYMRRDHVRFVDFEPIGALLYPNREDIADELNQRNLFAGTEQGYALTSRARRVESAIMLARFLGLNNIYTDAAEFPLPFSDVPGWAREDVAVLLKRGYTAGVSSNLFGSQSTTSLQMYATFIAIALGYEVGSDFTYADSKEFVISLGLISQGEAEAIEYRGFLRGDLVLLSYRALSVPVKGDSRILSAILGV